MASLRALLLRVSTKEVYTRIKGGQGVLFCDRQIARVIVMNCRYVGLDGENYAG